jgi:hypothetical protein
MLCAQALAQPASATDVPSPPQSSLQSEPRQPALYSQALRALAQNQPAQAQALLQAVVNQYPDLAGAWLDLALLALQQSHYPEADEYLLALEHKFAPLPPEIAQAVARMRERLTAQLQPGAQPGSVTAPRSQTALVMGTGYENNANSGLRMSTITLTTPDGDALLTVDPASQPKSSAYVRAGLVHQVTQSWLGGELNWQVQGQTRQYNSLSPYSNMELLPQVTATHPQLLGQITAGWQAIWLNQRGAYQTPIVRWQLDRALAQCNWRHQLQAEERQYLQASQLDSHWLSYRSTWQCQSGAARRQAYVQLAQENATHANRPGGDTRHHSLGVQQEWLNALGHEGHILQVKADWLHAQDSGTYNALLDHGKPRHLNRVDAQLSWSAPVAMQTGWRWSVSAQTNAQTSNVAFFNQRNFSLETSLWRAW